MWTGVAIQESQNVKPEDILPMVPGFIEVGKLLLDAVKSASAGDADGAYSSAKRAHDLLTLEIAKRELK